ncbi:hypothetical protein ACHAXT_008569 [Thalassiosira profunda]
MSASFNTKGLRCEVITARTNDEIHGSIKLCGVSKAIINTPHMQRLRNLSQLGVSQITYGCTTHNRWQHSLGVMHLAELMLTEISERQPRLHITKKDIVCVKLAGLLHDIGHGPYSHVYDGLFRKQLAKAEIKGSWLGHAIDSAAYEGLPEVMEGYAHEDASLMMIDALLRHLGLEIDESNLDAPLRQVSDGINAARFGIWDRMSDLNEAGAVVEPLPLELVLTSRDWIFIKECVAGGPLPPSGMSIDTFKESDLPKELTGRPDPHKEFLYDVVSNRHSGLDVDKMDYLARDTSKAHATNSISDLLPKMTEKAFVAWGVCSNPEKCWKCRGAQGLKHTMICYPDSTVQNCMSFFEKRWEEHQRLYQHSKTQRGNMMICDILLLADPYFRLYTIDDDEEGGEVSSPLPISRAMLDPKIYLELDDGILDRIMNTNDVRLRPSQRLIKSFREHKVYEKVGKPIVIGEAQWQQKLWDMDSTDIVSGILGADDRDALGEDDIIIDRRQIHHGMGARNPVDSMRFLSKDKHRELINSPDRLPEAKQVPGSSYRTPTTFLERSVRVFCRNEAKRKRLSNLYGEFIHNLQSEKSTGDERYTAIEYEPIDSSPSTPRKHPGGNAFHVTQSPPTVSQTPEKYDGDSARSNKRQRQEPQTLFDQVMSGNK